MKEKEVQYCNDAKDRADLLQLIIGVLGTFMLLMLVFTDTDRKYFMGIVGALLLIAAFSAKSWQGSEE